MELEFIYDQRRKIGVRGRFQIGSKDVAVSSKQENELRRQQMEQEREEARKAEQPTPEGELSSGEGKERDGDRKSPHDESSEDESLPTDHDPRSSSASGKMHGAQYREHFPRTVMAAMRHGVSVRGLANILYSYVVDMGLATKEDPHLLVDHSKVTGEQEREMARLTANAEIWLRTSGIDGVQFDGKEEPAKAWVLLEDGTTVIRHVKEDHITLTDSQGEFMMHFTRNKVDGVKAA